MGVSVQDLRALAPRGSLGDAAAGRAWAKVNRAGGLPATEAWAGECAVLARVPGAWRVMAAFITESAETTAALGATAVTSARQAVEALLRAGENRGASVLTACLPDLRRLLRDAAAFAEVLDPLAAFVPDAPEAASSLVGSLPKVLPVLGAEGFVPWLTEGRRMFERDPRGLAAYMALSDPRAERAMIRLAGGDRQREIHRAGLFAQSLWGHAPAVRSLGVRSGRVRASLDGDLLHLPALVSGIPREHRRDLWTAVFAHATAHQRFSPSERFAVGRLKPRQVAVASVIEDARVEALALRDFPGLRSFWLPFHQVDPVGPPSAEKLLARLARALIDPGYRDADSWVGKGVALFREADLADVGMAPHLGAMLGNDLGQMRLAFNPKAYVVEPAYRDDSLGLWRWDTENQPPDEEPDTAMESVRPVDGKAPDGVDGGSATPPPAETEVSAVATAPPEGAVEAGAWQVFSYPEWDYLIERDRPDWVTLREQVAPPGDARVFRRLIEGDTALRETLAGTMRAATVGRVTRIRRQREGEALDMDAAINAAIDLRRGQAPEPDIFQSRSVVHRDLAIQLLLDLSQSTVDRLPGGGPRVHEVIRAAASVLAMAMEAVGDACAIDAFQSNGRSRVDYYVCKSLAEPMGTTVQDRLAGPRSQLSTRMGPALRHAGVRLGKARAYRRLLLLITDGEPSDIDMADERYLIEDARRAVRLLGGQGISALAVGVRQGASSPALGRIFGARGITAVDDLSQLPDRLLGLYRRLRA